MVTEPLALTETQEDQIRDFIKKEISKNRGGISMRELLELASKEKDISERTVRYVLSEQEEAGEVYADWNWKYRITSGNR